MDVTFYLSPDTLTLRRFSELLRDLEEEGVGISQVVPVGLTGHMAVTGMDSRQALRLLELLKKYRGRLTNVRTRLGTFRDVYGETEVTPSRIRAYIMMNGRTDGVI